MLGLGFISNLIKSCYRKWKKFLRRHGNPETPRGIPVGSGPFKVGMVDVITEQHCGVNGRIFYPISDEDNNPNLYTQWFSRFEYAYGFAGFGGLSPKIFGPLLNRIFQE
ncbi:uncharacterized protein LOC142350571 [Convolutriloba macropyga]|uniref:uncharacterized protein LOC142350571 n=1 Tax=Convolutriloba macropyga TaxID=536237 RepID=UPI003F51F2A3